MKKGDDIREEEDAVAKNRFAREEDERLWSFQRVSLATNHVLIFTQMLRMHND